MEHQGSFANKVVPTEANNFALPKNPDHALPEHLLRCIDDERPLLDSSTLSESISRAVALMTNVCTRAANQTETLH